MSATPANCFHLTVEIVREVHAEAIERFGGSDGVREMALLESAVAAPQASFGGQSPYRDIAEVAAAYLFYLCKNHPFIDGNKRAALGACIVFLRLNGIEPKPDGPAWEELTLAVAASEVDRDEATRRLRKLLPKQKFATIAEDLKR
jgi:death on curing protein